MGGCSWDGHPGKWVGGKALDGEDLSENIGDGKYTSDYTLGEWNFGARKRPYVLPVSINLNLIMPVKTRTRSHCNLPVSIVRIDRSDHRSACLWPRSRELFDWRVWFLLLASARATLWLSPRTALPSFPHFFVCQSSTAGSENLLRQLSTKHVIARCALKIFVKGFES